MKTIENEELIKAIKRILLRLIENPELCESCYESFGTIVRFKYADIDYDIEFSDNKIDIRAKGKFCKTIIAINYKEDNEINSLLNSLNQTVQDFYINKIISASYNI